MVSEKSKFTIELNNNVFIIEDMQEGSKGVLGRVVQMFLDKLGIVHTISVKTPSSIIK